MGHDDSWLLRPRLYGVSEEAAPNLIAALSSWLVEALDQGEEPESSRDEPGDGGVWMISNFHSNLLIAVVVGAGAVEPFQRIGLKQGHARSHPPP